jgi:ankyrin repeat protein
MQGIDVNLADQDGRTPLMLAIQDGDLPTVQALLSHGANVNATDNDGWTPLMSAAEYGHLPIIQVLLSAPGIDIDAKQSDGTTALIFAAFRGKDDVAKALIHKGANVNATDNDGWTPLMSAAQKGHLATVQILLNAPDIDINARHNFKHNALYLAAFHKRDDVAIMLIENVADISQLYKKIKTADYSDEEQHLPSLDYLMHYLAQRQADVGNLSIEATWASIFATSAIPIQGDQTAIPSLQALALDAHIHKTQADGPSLAQMAFQTIRDQLLQQKLSAADVVKLISTFNSSTFATALVQTLAIASQLGHYRTESEHQLIFNALQTSGLYGVYEKSQSCLDPDNINRWQVSGQTLLTRAAQAGDQLLVDALIHCGAAHHLHDQHGNNALHAAVKAGKWSVCHHLLALGANPNTSDRSGISTLTYLAQAFAKGDEQAAIIVATLLAPLLARGYRLDRVVKNPDPARPWEKTTIRAILQSNLNRFGSHLHLLYADDINLADANGHTPLMFAAQHGLVAILQVLMTKGANVNLADNNGWTPLMAAAAKGHLTIIEALLSALDIDINAQKADGATALIVAAANGQHEVVKTLIDNGAKVNATSTDGWKPLMFAAEKGHLTTVQALLSVTGIDIDAQKADGATALIVAAANGKDEVVKALINNGANVNAMDNNGSTPLMWALRLGHQTIAQALLDNGAIPNKPTATA